MTEAAPRIGLVGCGAIVRRSHLPALVAGGAQVVAVAGGSQASAQRFVGECCPDAVAAPDWRAVVENEDVDAVVVSSPNARHAEQALAAIAAGKHVLVEKPMTTSEADADELVWAAAQQPGLVVMPAHNARFAPVVLAARERASITKVSELRLQLSNRGPLVWSPGSTWFLDPEQAGGGVLLDLGVHVLDAARAVLQEELAVVSAALRRDDGIDVEAEVELQTVAGVNVSIAVSWRAQASGFELTLIGPGGPLPVEPNLGVPADSVQAAFLRAVAGGSAYSPTAVDGRAAVVLACQAYSMAP